MRANVFVQGHQMSGRSWCGAGVILGQTGGRVFLITNKHVTDPFGSGGPSELSVTFANGEIAGGKVEWTGPDGVDLAVVSAAATRPPRVLTRIRRSMLTVGEKTFGIGNPYSLAWTYTEGVCSRVYSKHTNVGGNLDLVQTQTPIHPGNSGGGLYDGNGRLVGINTWVIESEGGPGFAISSKTIIDIVPQRYVDLTSEDSNDKEEGN
jgi:S1-C subfamily serine protease